MKFSNLEKLTPDLLIAVLSACEKLADPASFIGASPVLLISAFRVTKPAILLQVVSSILGPATRDAAFLAVTSEFPGHLSTEDLKAQVDKAISSYRVRLRVIRSPWATAITEDIGVALDRIARTTEQWIDIYKYLHFHYFDSEIDQPARNVQFLLKPRLSRTEHGRLAQATLRQPVVALVAALTAASILPGSTERWPFSFTRESGTRFQT
ncbi:hypothetical protein PWT90_07309 [Aphanocladium album]|nr:hypothetical protein PWT90_07309 [Aphanocladium album]